MLLDFLLLVRMFAGSAQELKRAQKQLKGTTAFCENTSASCCRPVAVGRVEASLDARDCGCRAVVCICTEASELPDLLTEEGKEFLTVEDELYRPVGSF